MSTEPHLEYAAARERAALINWSTTGVVAVRGADRAALLQNVLTQDIRALEPGTGGQAALLSPTGHVVATFVVLADEDTHWLLCDRSRASAVVAALQHYVITEDVTLEDHSPDHAVFLLLGPRSAAYLAPSDAAPSSAGSFRHIHTRLVDHAVHLIADPRWSLPAWLLVVRMSEAERLWTTLIARGAQATGWEAFNSLRLEAGWPWFGVDFDETCLLTELGAVEALLSETKGCYVGQEIVARVRSHGSVSRQLMRLQCEGRAIPTRGDTIQIERQPVGHITSAAWSFGADGPLAVGWVKRPHYVPGAKVTISSGKQHIVGTLEALGQHVS